MAKISVIVPIYNVEKQLNRCLDSIIKQEYQDIQIILVNDGSTDESGIIAKEYANKYADKIEYYEKENGGLSDARNYGLKHVVGDYIAFVDSDDYISSNLFSDLEKYMNDGYDIIKFKFAKVSKDGSLIENNKSPIFENKTGEEAFEILFKEDKMMDVAWSYLYKKDFFINNKFEYAKGLYHEDFGLTLLILMKAKKVASTDVLGYNYVQTENSITRGNKQAAVKRATDLLIHYDNMINVIEKYDISNKSKENIKMYYTNNIILAIQNLTNKSDIDNYIKEIKKRKMTKNIKAINVKQLIKKILLSISIKLYLKVR